MIASRAGQRADVSQRRESRSPLLPSFGDLVFMVCLLIVLGAAANLISRDGDPSRHLAVGEHILSTGAILSSDVFSHTMAGQHFVPYEWLAEVLSALSFRVAGLAGPVLLHGAIIAVSYVVLFRHLRLDGRGATACLGVTLVAMAVGMLHWLPRPHVFTFLGVALFAGVLDGWSRGALDRRWLWLLPAVNLVWANTHGGFLVGFILVATYLIADGLRRLLGAAGVATPAGVRLRQLAPIAAAAIGATLVNPAGPELLRHTSGYLGKKLLVDMTNEYRSPNFHEPIFLPFLAMLVCLFAALAWSRRRPALHECFLLFGFTYFALYAARNIPLFAIVVAPLLLRQVAELPPLEGRAAQLWAPVAAWLHRRTLALEAANAWARAGAWSCALLLVLVTLAALAHRDGAPALGVTYDPSLQPVGAVAYLQANPPSGRMFNELAWGGYLLRELWPRHEVFIDGQTDFYGEPLAREYLQIVELGHGWRETLERRSVDWVIYPTDTVLTRALEESGAWTVVYRDGTAAVLTRAARG